MSNQVQVDELDIDRQFEILEADGDAAAREAETQQLEVNQDAESWLSGARMAIDIIDAKVCPNWELAEQEKEQLTASFARVLDRYFPGAIAGIDNWHPIAQLAATAGGIAALRFDWQVGRLPPMKKPRKENDEFSDTRGRDADGSDGGEPLGENGLSFAAGPQ